MNLFKYLLLFLLSCQQDRPYLYSEGAEPFHFWIEMCVNNCENNFNWHASDGFERYIDCMKKLPEYEKLQPNNKWRCRTWE